PFPTRRSSDLVALLARRAVRLGDADPRPPRVGPRRPLPRHAGRGDLHEAKRRARARRAARARAGRLLRPDPAPRRHPPRADDLRRDVSVDPPADERHRLRLAAHVRPGVGGGEAVPLGLRQRRLLSYLVPLMRQLSNPSPSLERLRSAEGKRTVDPSARPNELRTDETSVG